MLLFGPSGRPRMTLFFLAALSERSQWWIELNSYLGSGSWLCALLVPDLSMSGRCSPSCAGSGSVYGGVLPGFAGG